ncbi:MAG TPA: PQQ-binding-like beta-propeller repeat protein [Vicinamibacterales bacterium]
MKVGLSISALVLSTAVLSAQDWSQWRGPSRTGITTGFVAPASWPERPKQAWKVTAGIGHSSPVVSGTRVFLLSRIGEQEAVTAYDLTTGKQIWRQAYDAPYQMNPAATSHGKGPKATPLVHQGRVYTLGISGTLSALDASDGRVVWRKDFKREFKETSPVYGAAMSPVADGANVIAHVGGDSNGALTAFDAATGGVKWAWKGDGPAYASPVIATLGGVRQVVTQTQSRVVGLSAADGALLWEIPFTTDYDQNIITPVIVGNDTVIYGGLSKPAVAVRVWQNAGKWNTAERWRNAEIPMYMSSPIDAGGTLYGLTHRNKGQFFAVNTATGKMLWISEGRQGDNAALTSAGNLLIATTTEGELVIARKSPTAFDVVRRYTVAESPVWAHPALAGGGVLIKDAETLAYWVF